MLAAVIAPASLLLTMARADTIFAPTDPILGGQRQNGTDFAIGAIGGAGNTWPMNESPTQAIDGTNAKYLNFGQTNTGILVTPQFNGGTGSVITSLELWTANDAENRDPASFEIWGTNAALTFAGATSFSMSLFAQIAAGDLILPSTRNTVATAVTFANTSAYKNYLIIFPTIKNNPGGNANSMQIGEIRLFGMAPVQSLVWAGTNLPGGNIWNIAAAVNWLAGGIPATFTNTSPVLFNDDAANTDVNVLLAVQPASMTFQNITKNYTLSGTTVSSSGALVFAGTGTVTINNPVSFASGALVNAGTVNVGTVASLGVNPLTLNNTNTGAGTNVTLNFNSAQTIGTLAGNVSTPASGTNTASIHLNGTLTVNQTALATYQGTITGTGGLTKTGNGTLTLTGANTYTGPTIVNAGTLASNAPGDNANGALPAGQPVTVNSGATLLFGADDGLGYYLGSVASLIVNGGTVVSAAGTHSTLPAVTLNAGTLTAAGPGNVSGPGVVNYILDGNVTTVAAATPSAIRAPAIRLRGDPTNSSTGSAIVFNVPRGTASADLIVTSPIQDTGFGLTKTGNGLMVLQSASTYLGPTTISGGTLQIKDSSALGSSDVTMNTGGILSFGPTGTISGFLDFARNGGAAVDATNSIATLTDGAGNETRSVFSNTRFSTLNGFTASFVYTPGGNRAADGMTFTLQSASPTVLGGGGGGLAYSGLTNAAALEFNIYTGAGQPTGTAYSTTGTTGVYTSSAPVDIASGHPIAVTVVYNAIAHTVTETLTDQLTSQSYLNTFSGIDLSIAVGSTAYVGFTGATGGANSIQTVGSFLFDSLAPGVSIANTVSVSSGATVGWEVLPTAAGGASTVTMQGALTINGGVTVNVTGGTTPTNSAYTLVETSLTTLGGNVTFNVANNGNGKGILTLGQVNDFGTTANLTKTGNGTLILSADSGYGGATIVNGGTLAVNASLVGTAIAVNTSGTLGGAGSVESVQVNSGGTVAPGNPLGTLNATSLSLLSGSTLALDIDATTADQVKISGAAALTGMVNLSITLTADPNDNTTFTIVDGSTPLGGIGAGARFSYQGTPLNQGDVFTVNSGVFTQAFSISYTADANHDVVLTAILVPEPATATILLAGLGCLLGTKRRKR